MSNFPNRIVYVDDEAEMRNIVKKVFEHSDRDIVLVTCSSGRELLNRLRELQPDLILLDLQMPDMNGPDTIEELRKDEDAIDTPIIFMTGKKDVIMLENYKNLGVIGIIHKPFDVVTLLETIEGFWGAHMQGEELLPEQESA